MPRFPRPSLRRASYLRDVIIELVLRDLNLRYKRSFLGIVWSLVTPLAQLLVLRFIFTAVLPLDVPNYTAFLFIGILVWSWLQTALDQAAGTIVENRELVRLAGFPVAILPVVTVAANLTQFLFALPILAVFLWFGGATPLTAAPLLLPLLIAIQFLMLLSLAYFIAALHVRFRDIKHLLQIILMLGFYLTPVFYELRQAPTEYALIYVLNPMVHLIGAYRAILLHGTLPALLPLAGVTGASLVLLIFSYRRFVRASSNFVDEL
ncbi:MAG: ABC transporter permease [Gemmatimonadales bacterium]|nr:ABC transporter permease [Gemmatimonadales bacterium]